MLSQVAGLRFPLAEFQCICVPHLLYSFMFDDEHLGCSFILCIVNNIGVHVSIQISVFYFSRYMIGLELLDHMVALFLIF